MLRRVLRRAYIVRAKADDALYPLQKIMVISTHNCHNSTCTLLWCTIFYVFPIFTPCKFSLLSSSCLFPTNEGWVSFTFLCVPSLEFAHTWQMKRSVSPLSRYYCEPRLGGRGGKIGRQLSRDGDGHFLHRDGRPVRSTLCCTLAIPTKTNCWGLQYLAVCCGPDCQGRRGGGGRGHRIGGASCSLLYNRIHSNLFVRQWQRRFIVSNVL